MEHDDRFSRVGSDPVFKKRYRKKQIAIDKRFVAALRDPKRFGLASGPVDKYGRSVRAEGEELRPFYALQEEEAETEPSLVLPSSMIDEGQDADGSSSSDEDSKEAQDSSDRAWDADLPATHEEGDAPPEGVRLAITDCDWDHMRALDLIAVLQSLCSRGGRVLRVDVYLSDFGQKEQDYEALHGPRIRGDGPEAIRRYELSKLRRFFAIATLDAPATAAAVYANDGLEIEATSASLNLAYVPDDIALDPARIRDSASEVDTSYKPPPQYYVAARQQTKVGCSWEADEPERDRAFSKQDDDLQLYVAPHEEAQNQDAASLRQKLGLDDAEAAPTASLRKKLGLDDTEVAPTPDDNFFAINFQPALEPSSGGDGDDEATRAESRASKRKVKRRKSSTASTTERRDDDQVDYELRELEKAERLKGKKLRGKRKRDRQHLLAHLGHSEFKLNDVDPRFAPVFDGSDSRFGLDPTAPAFRKTAAMQHILNIQATQRKAG